MKVQYCDVNEMMEDVVHEARFLTKKWIEDLEITGPPMPVFKIAAWCDIKVTFASLFGTKLAQRNLTSRGIEILLNVNVQGDPVVWNRRLNFALAHEIMALNIRISAPDFAYQRAASELLLYRPWLKTSIKRHDWNPALIAREFDVSVEAAGRAMVELDECVFTVVDNLQTTSRVIGPLMTPVPKELLATEKQVIQKAFDLWVPQELRDEQVKVKAWPVDPAGSIKRVVAMTWSKLA